MILRHFAEIAAGNNISSDMMNVLPQGHDAGMIRGVVAGGSG